MTLAKEACDIYCQPLTDVRKGLFGCLSGLAWALQNRSARGTKVYPDFQLYLQGQLAD